MLTALLALCLSHPAMAADMPPAQLQILKSQTTPTLQIEDSAGKYAPKTNGSPLTAVHFWATWCVPCVSELPQVDDVQQQYADKGFKVIAISLDTTMEKVQSFFVTHRIKNLTPALDVSTSSFQSLQIKGLPATVFYNAKGEAIARADGPLEWDGPEIKKFIESQLGK